MQHLLVRTFSKKLLRVICKMCTFIKKLQIIHDFMGITINAISLDNFKFVRAMDAIVHDVVPLIKSAIGLHKYYRNSPLLNAMNVNKIPKLRDIYNLIY